MARPKATETLSPDLSVLGTTGLKITGGYVFEEFHRDLGGTKAVEVYKRMRDDDPIVGAILYALNLYLRRLDWYVSPADDSAEAKALCDLVQAKFAAMRTPWASTLSEILSFLDFGWAVLEMLFRRDADGSIGWEDWEIRGQDTLLRWERDDRKGPLGGRPSYEVVGMHQLDPYASEEAYIPLAKCLHLTTVKRKGNPEGKSILRNAYRAWYRKRHIEDVEGIGIERDLAGLPVMFAPPELFSRNANADQKAIFESLKKIVTNVRRDEQEGILMPMMYDAQGKQLYDFKLLSTGGSRAFDTNKTVVRYDERIALTVLGDLFLLGHKVGGSYALAEVKQDAFIVCMDTWADVITTEVDRKAIAQLCRLNGYVDPTIYPHLTHSPISEASLDEISTFLQKTALAGFVWAGGEGGDEAEQLGLANWLLGQIGAPVKLTRLATTPEPPVVNAAGATGKGGARQQRTRKPQASDDNQ